MRREPATLLPSAKQHRLAKSPGSKQSDETDHDQIDGHNKVQQFRHDQNENPRQERDQGGKAQVKVHGLSNGIDRKKVRVPA